MMISNKGKSLDEISVRVTENITLDLLLSVGIKFTPQKIYKIKGKRYSALIGKVELPFELDMEDSEELLAEFRVEKYGSPKFVAFRGFQSARDGFVVTSKLSQYLGNQYNNDNEELERVMKDIMFAKTSWLFGIILCIILAAVIGGTYVKGAFYLLAVLIALFRKPLTMQKCKLFKDFGGLKFYEFNQL